jgi:hypothetical protein
MDSLVNPHWEATPLPVRHVLQNLAHATSLEPFYLAGGTALALRLGHRISVDLDFFGAVETFDDDWRRRLTQELRQHFTVEVLRNSPLGLALDVDKVSVGFFTYGYKLLDALQKVHDVALAGLTDIGLMKLEAIADRGARKDFIDLYFIAQHISIEQLLNKIDEKYPHFRFFESRVLEALIDFDVADTQADSTMLVPIEWEQIKEYCIAEAIRIGKKRFEGT